MCSLYLSQRVFATRATAARPTSSRVNRIRSSRVRKTWVVGSRGGGEVVVAGLVVVGGVVGELVRCTTVLDTRKIGTLTSVVVTVVAVVTSCLVLVLAGGKKCHS